MFERTFVGLDVHARSVVACGIDTVTGEVSRARLTPDHGEIWTWLAGLEGPIAVAYEAGPTGFGLARFLAARSVRCVVAAPSKITRAPGDRVKTDARDAMLLARLLKLDDLTAVTVPSMESEAARDLVRAREDCRGDLMSARHRLSKLLLRQGIVWSGGQAWTGAHDDWLRRQRFEEPARQLALRVCLRDGRDDTGAAEPARRRDRRDGGGQCVHAGRGPARLPARHLHPHRVRPRGRDRRLAPVHRLHDRRLRRPGPDRSPRPDSPARRGRSPRPATPTSAGSWSKRRGTTAVATTPEPR